MCCLRVIVNFKCYLIKRIDNYGTLRNITSSYLGPTPCGCVLQLLNPECTAFISYGWMSRPTTNIDFFMIINCALAKSHCSGLAPLRDKTRLSSKAPIGAKEMRERNKRSVNYYVPLDCLYLFTT